MRRLDYKYCMELIFSEPVNRHHFTLRCLPRENERQQIRKEHLQIEPDYLGGFETDSFGNRCVYGKVERPHQRFLVEVTGTVETDQSIELFEKEPHKLGMFRYPAGLTKVGAALQKLSEGHPSAGKELEDYGREIMDVVYHHFSYEPGATSADTTAEEAAALGKGVCQDYAQVMLALCRRERIPCRYVAGMLLGEGASHAWVELCDGKRWLAFDPTHNCMADDGYICISYGRDAADSPINQGDFYGTGKSAQKQEIYVMVEESND